MTSWNVFIYADPLLVQFPDAARRHRQDVAIGAASLFPQLQKRVR